ncbi:MAG: invasion associated locus B family protein [Rhodobacterales bacterium]|nr:MAG: invasion associated locus B family protein [Rhodobacterales bacterium]
MSFKAVAQEAVAQPTTEAKVPDGPVALSETYGDWVVSCQQANATSGMPTRICQMSQELRQREGNQLLLLIAITPSDTAAPRATLVAPFGLKLSEGAAVAVGDKTIANAPFDTCLPAGCIAYLDLNPDAMDSLLTGEVAQVVLMPTQSQERLLIEISLAGFTTAWARLNLF